MSTSSPRHASSELAVPRAQGGRPAREGAFLRAASHGDVDALRALLAQQVDLNVRDVLGWTALHFACHAHALAACQLLLEAGADVNAADNAGHTPLHRAVCDSAGRGELIGLLRAYGADPYSVNDSGTTPLELARSSGIPRLVSYFGDLPWPAKVVGNERSR